MLLNSHFRWTSKKDDGDDRQPSVTGNNIFNDTLAKLDRFSHRSDKGHGNDIRGNGSARSISVLPAPKVDRVFYQFTILILRNLVIIR